MRKKVKGSLTVFFAMIMVAVMGLIFTMSGCIRYYELHDFAAEYTDMAVESVFSEYNPYLWTNYKILAIDLGYGTENQGPGILEQKALEYVKYNSDIESGHNYARLYPETAYAKTYSLLTDNQGQPVVKLGVKAAKEGIASQVIDGIQGHIDSINNVEKVLVEEKAKAGKDSLKQAKEANENAKQAARDDDDPNTNPEDYPEPEEVEDNPLDAFDELSESFSKGVLSTITEVDKISDTEIKLDETPSHRTLQSGNMNLEADGNLVDKALFIDYLLTNYGYYGHDLKHDGIKYEVEYLLSGKSTDTQCLASVVEQIMLAREAANFATIMANPSMVAEAEKIAATIAGFSMNPVVVQLVTAAIIAAWAYAESTLDLRLILSGGKVAPVKTLDQWTSDVWHLSQVANVKFKAKDCGAGLGYKEFLMAFLALRSNSTLSMRSLDVMENALNSTEDYAKVKIDNMLWAADIQMGYSAKEMFLSLFNGNGQEESGEYYFEKNKFLEY